MVVENEFDFGEVVYLKTDKEQLPRIVFCIKSTKADILYELACGTITSTHYGFEISKEVSVLLTTTN